MYVCMSREIKILKKKGQMEERRKEEKNER
jgi:hypothetical protein